MRDVCMNFSVVGSTKYTATVLTDLVSGIVVVQKRKDFGLQMEKCSVSLEWTKTRKGCFYENRAI
jgi:hypothetical protein